MSTISSNNTHYTSNYKCSKCHTNPGIYFTTNTELLSRMPYLCSTCITKIRVELRNINYKKIS